MKFSLALLAFALQYTIAAPSVVKRANSNSTEVPTDTQTLQLALSVEHLGATFYKTHLAQFNAAAFTAAGFPTWVRNRLVQIGEHEAEHVTAISAALAAINATEVLACNYTFPVNNVQQFVSLAGVLEGVDTSAYIGSSQYLTDSEHRTVAAAILSTEARHNAWISSIVSHGAPWSGAFDTPLSFSEVNTLASPFIVSCPNSNPGVPLQRFPRLVVAPPNPSPGSIAVFTFNPSNTSGPFTMTRSSARVKPTPLPLPTTRVPANSTSMSMTVANVTSTTTTSRSTTTTTTSRTTSSTPFTTSSSSPSRAVTTTETIVPPTTSTGAARFKRQNNGTTSVASTTTESTTSTSSTTSSTPSTSSTAAATTSSNGTTTSSSAIATATPTTGLFAAFLSGLNTTFVPLSSTSPPFRVTIPQGLKGTVYTVITNSTTGNVTDDTIIAGPAILMFDYPSTLTT